MSVERAGEVLKTLKSSEHPYLHIIYWQCRRETDTNIATARLNPTVSANYVFQRKKELEIAFITHHVSYPSPEVCEALEKYFTGPPRFDIREGVTLDPIVIEQTPVDPPPPPPQTEQQPDPTPPSQGEQVILPPARQTTKREGCLSLPVLLGALLLVVTGLLIWSLLTDQSEPVDRIVEVTREIEVIVIQTAPPIEVTRVVELINTVEVPVVQTVVQTVISEVPVTVEVTPLPPTPTSLPQTVTISEDFDDFEIDPAFTVVGEPQFAQGRMNVGSPVTISIGDETWKNYSLSFDVDILGGNQIGMTIRDQGTSKLRYAQDGIYWWSGTWQYLGSGGEYVSLIESNADWRPRVEILVEDNRVIHTTPNSVVTIANTYSDSGGITITLGGMWIDNLVITRND